MSYHHNKPVVAGAAQARSHPRHRRIPARCSALLAVAMVLPVAGLTGCANHSTNDFEVGSVSDTYKTRHPIVIDEQEKVLDIPVPSSSYQLTVPTVSSIQGFAAGYKQGANGVITVLLPSGSPNESAARSLLPEIVDALSGEGISRNRVRSATYYAADHGSSAPVRLSYSAVTANVGECGKWTEDLAGPNAENKNYHNFGCAYQNNIAAQIANPADLISPRGMTPIDAERRNTAIQDYRDGNIGSTTNIDSVFQ